MTKIREVPDFREQAFLKGSACYNLAPRALTIPRHCDSPLRGSRHDATVSIFSLDAWVCICPCVCGRKHVGVASERDHPPSLRTTTRPTNTC
jgi:hypothetical protein